MTYFKMTQVEFMMGCELRELAEIDITKAYKKRHIFTDKAYVRYKTKITATREKIKLKQDQQQGVE